jgi:tetratricopeptide (TPR) repeat protein
MNLSRLEHMVRDGDMSADALRYLLNCRGECEWLDYKETLRVDHDKELCDFAKDCLAMKNVGGGYIVIGVQDKTWKPLGLAGGIPYDTKMLRDKIRHAAGTELDVDLVNHDVQMPGSSGSFALIHVRASKKRRKRRTPTVVGKDFCHTQSFGIRRGDVYVRSGDSTKRVASQAELEDLLDSLESQADQDALESGENASPFAVEDGTYRLLEKGFDHFVGREALRQEVLSPITRDPRIWIINVHGPGGVGKSALVNWAVYEIYGRRDFEAILHLTGKEAALTQQGIVKISRSLYSLENLLDHILDTFQEAAPTDLDRKKTLVIDYLSVYRTLLVLDNMETVSDSRILAFVQNLPQQSQAKALLTSRQKTGGWELPVPVQEMSLQEVSEFLRVRTTELGVECPHDRATVEKIWQASGGLPLAIQWIIGRCRKTRSLEPVLHEVNREDSPVLEFTFGNIWRVLSRDAKAILAATSIFDEPPTVQQLAVATQFPAERIEKALGELSEVTLVNRNTQASDGRARHVALPITLAFAGHQLQTMGDFEIKCRQRVQKFDEQMELQESEVFRFRSRFDRFGLTSDNEKRAAILCQRGQSEMFVGNIDNADTLFRQARELAPQSAYVYAMCASYELARNRLGSALGFAEEGCRRANRRTGSLCYAIKARVLDVQHDKMGRVEALRKALEYDSNDMLTRHQYGVALSRAGYPQEAIKEFTVIIDADKQKVPATSQLLMALKTRIINWMRVGRQGEAKRDLAWAEDVIKRNPHLATHAADFREFRE